MGSLDRSACRYVVAGSKSWNFEVYSEIISKFPGEWTFISKREELTYAALETVQPRFVFFLHWSWMVPPEIVAAFECVCFHMTDLPYGRGGSPLQNLILEGRQATKLTAFRMTSELDAGPVYAKADLQLEGKAAEILKRASGVSAEIIRTMITKDIKPTPQSGEPVLFKRRSPAESELPPLESIEKLYDFIRMLDGEGYPPAFLQRDGFRFEFKNANLKDGKISAVVNIAPVKEIHP